MSGISQRRREPSHQEQKISKINFIREQNSKADIIPNIDVLIVICAQIVNSIWSTLAWNCGYLWLLQYMPAIKLVLRVLEAELVWQLQQTEAHPWDRG